MSALRTVGDMGDRAFGLLDARRMATTRQLHSPRRRNKLACGDGGRWSDVYVVGHSQDSDCAPFALGLFAAVLIGGVSFLLISLFAADLIGWMS